MRFELRTTIDGSLTVFDREAGECFKSRHAARLESEHVFFQPGVKENPLYGRASPFRVLELGFGLGTNFLHLLEAGFQGEFLSIERDLSGVEFFLSQNPNPALATLVRDRFLESSGFRARLLVDQFSTALETMKQEFSGNVHAVFFDPFSPAANPEAWNSPLFRQVAGLLAPEGRLVTYSVSRAAKDGAQGAGLTVTKRDLPKELHKRSALLAVKPSS